LEVRANPASWRGYDPLPPEPVLKESEETEDGTPGSGKAGDAKLKGHWNLRLSSFQKLVFIKTFQEEKVCAICRCHVTVFLGFLVPLKANVGCIVISPLLQNGTDSRFTCAQNLTAKLLQSATQNQDTENVMKKATCNNKNIVAPKKRSGQEFLEAVLKSKKSL